MASEDYVEVIDENRYDVSGLIAGFDTIHDAADAFEVDERTIHRWINDGVSWWRADEICGRLQIHPGSVWPEWWDITFEGEEEQLELGLAFPA